MDCPLSMPTDQVMMRHAQTVGKHLTAAVSSYICTATACKQDSDLLGAEMRLLRISKVVHLGPEGGQTCQVVAEAFSDAQRINLSCSTEAPSRSASNQILKWKGT